ncbi:MAG: FAD-dependent oxidoreductase [Thermomicrobiales bacterium]|nr:FAD-dependent oxidoreductase [Thermomicrobiales bacterium]
MSAPISAVSGRLPVVVVGAGLAGLVCASALHEVGQPVLVLERADEVGGRVRTRRHPEGFLLDRGFQVLLDAYPAARRWIDHPALRPLPFDAGVWIWSGRRLLPLVDPVRHPESIVRDVTAPLFGLDDKARLVKYALAARRADWQSAAEAGSGEMAGVTAVEALRAAGFSPAFIERFARPFWGGITLDPELRQSAGPMLFTLKMLVQGRAVLPAEGVGAMPRHLAQRLPLESLRIGVTVDDLACEGGSVRGVRVGGETIAAAAVVVATDPPEARRLTGVTSLPDASAGLGSLTVYLTGERDPRLGRRLALDGTGQLTLDHLADLSAVQPNYAPPGRRLLAATILGDALAGGDSALADRTRRGVATMLGHDLADWQVLDVVRVPFSQFAQPPGIYERRPTNTTGQAGLYLATEATVDSSYNGAILSGEAAARAVLRDQARANQRKRRR